MTRKRVAFVFNCKRSESLDEAEFDTPEVIAGITHALEAKYEVIPIEVTRNGSWLRKLETAAPDVILNTAEGFRGAGRESLAPVSFEQLGLHYAGPGPYQCFLTLDKYLTKQVVLGVGVQTPEAFLVQEMADLDRLSREITFPVFAKPNFEGSSKGISEDSRCPDENSLRRYLKKNLPRFPEGILVERYVEGKDVTVPFLAGLGDGGVLEPVEYYRGSGQQDWIYDYNLKNVDDSDVLVRCPALLDRGVLQRIGQAMRKVVSALSIADMARADFRVTPAGDVFFIEINALPSLQKGAGLFEASRRLGYDYDATIQQIVASALARKDPKTSTKVARQARTRDPRVALVYNLRRLKSGDSGYENESEFDASATVDALAKAIEKNGYETHRIEMTPTLSEDLLAGGIDVVFNIAEGTRSRTREAQVPALCDLIGMEHTGGDATCLALTLDKSTTNRLMSVEGVRVPRSSLVTNRNHLRRINLRFPIIAKPNAEGTSKGIYEDSVADTPEALERSFDRLMALGDNSILCEEFIDGREFTVGVLGNQNLSILGPSELVFKPRGEKGVKYPVYSFESKQASDPLDNEFYRLECPPDISPTLRRRIGIFAKRCFRIVGCRDVARIDLRVDGRGDIFFIEINPLPGLSPGFSDLSILAEKSGMSYHDLIGTILKPAVLRWRKRRSPAAGAAR